MSNSTSTNIPFYWVISGTNSVDKFKVSRIKADTERVAVNEFTTENPGLEIYDTQIVYGEFHD